VTTGDSSWEHPFGTIVDDAIRAPPARILRLRPDVVRNERGAASIEDVYRSLAHTGSR
jgi:hypothetical protein